MNDSNEKGVTFPCIHAVWSKWAPPLERSRMSTVAFAGTYAGTVVAMPASGVLAQMYGWESLFYVFGSYQVNTIHMANPTHIVIDNNVLFCQY